MRILLLVIFIPFLGTSADESRPKISVGAYYYPWYHSDGRHWKEGYEGKPKGLKPALGEYSSRSVHTIRKHIGWSQKLGIDHWICSWWGPQSWEDETLRNYVAPLLERADEAAPKFCIFYESAGLLGLDPEKGIDFDLAGNADKFVAHFRYLAQNYFSNPRYLRINGKPVVYIYLSRTFTGDYVSAILQARASAKTQGGDLFLVGDEVFWGEPDEKRIRQFDAITSYNMHGPKQFSGLTDFSPFLKEVDDVYQRYRESANRLGTGFIPGIMPGFDSRDASGIHYQIPRSLNPGADNLSFLRNFAQIAKRQLDPKLEMMAITSFNEWHEGTQLEPREAENTTKRFKAIREIITKAK